MRIIALCATGLILGACQNDDRETPAPSPSTASSESTDPAPERRPDVDTDPSAELEPAFRVTAPTPEVLAARAQARAILEAAAMEYRSWGIADPDLNWSPLRCAAPVPPVSQSDDAATHGQKLYYLFAKSREPYRRLTDWADAVGQVIVKETWHPKPTDQERGPQSKPFATKDGQSYEPGEQGPLFIMARVDPNTPETDDGWIYGVVSPDRSEFEFGRLQNCMDCHQDANQGRLFGL